MATIFLPFQFYFNIPRRNKIHQIKNKAILEQFQQLLKFKKTKQNGLTKNCNRIVRMEAMKWLLTYNKLEANK